MDWGEVWQKEGRLYCSKIKKWCTYTDPETGECSFREPEVPTIPDMIDCPKIRQYENSKICLTCEYAANEDERRHGRSFCKFKGINRDMPVVPEKIIKQDALDIAGRIRGLVALRRLQKRAELDTENTDKQLAALAEILSASGRYDITLMLALEEK